MVPTGRGSRVGIRSGGHTKQAGDIRGLTQGVQHENAGLGDNGWLSTGVTCNAIAGTLADSAPYARTVAPEVAEPSEESLHQQVRARVQPRIDVPGA